MKQRYFSTLKSTFFIEKLTELDELKFERFENLIFFQCNATVFMVSIFLIKLVQNGKFVKNVWKGVYENILTFDKNNFDENTFDKNNFDENTFDKNNFDENTFDKKHF